MFTSISAVAVGFVAKLIGMKAVYGILGSTWLLGTLIYISAIWPFSSPWVILIGRCISGSGTALFSLGLSYISLKITDDSERAKAIVTYRGFTILATLASSVLAVVFSIPAIGFSLGPVEFNLYTYPAWCNLILILTSLTLALISLKEPDDTPQTPGKQESGSSKCMYISKGTILAFVIIFFNGYTSGSLGYTMPIVILEEYGWTVLAYSGALFVFSLVNTASSFSVRFVAKIMGLMKFLTIVPALGIVCLLCVVGGVSSVGVDLLGPTLGVTLFLISSYGIFSAFLFEHTMISVIMSSITPREFLVRMMPLTSAIYTTGKIVSPLVAELESNLTGLALVYYTLLVFSGVVLFLAIIFTKNFYTEDQSVRKNRSLLEENHAEEVS